MKFKEIDFNLKNTAVIAAFVLLLFVMYQTRSILILFMISVLISYLLNPVVEFFVKLKIPRVIGVLLLVAMLVMIIIAATALVLPSLINDIIHIASNTPHYINIVFDWIEKALNYFNVHRSLDLESSKAFIAERIGVISKYVLNTVTSAAASVKGAALFLINLFIVPVIVFFLLADFPDFKAFTDKFVEKFNMQRIMEHLIQFEKLVGKYFRGMFLVGLILSCLYGTVLLIVGVRGAVILGILTGMGAMIPYIGFSVGLISSLIATAITYQDIIHPVYTLIGFIIVQILESMVITPKIVGDSLGINPVVVIVGLMIGGALAGFIGMLLALPTAAFIKILLDQYIFKNGGESGSTDKNENRERQD